MMGPYKVRCVNGQGAFVQEIDADSWGSTAHGLLLFFKGVHTVAVLSVANVIDVTGEPDPEHVHGPECDVNGALAEQATEPEADPEPPPSPWGDHRGTYL
jgi:hypothetical protein